MTARGPRLGTKLLLASLLLLVLPWLGWRALQSVEGYLVDGQQQALLLTARGVATLLGEPLAALAPTPAGAEPLVVRPLETAPLFDGYPGDWDELVPAGSDLAANDGLFSFSARLGTHGGVLYGLLRVDDPQVVYRHPGIPRPDSSDHLLLTLAGGAGQRRLILAAEGPGFYAPLGLGHGLPGTAVAAAWQPTASGYTVEFRVPLGLLGSPPLLGLNVVDVGDPVERQPRARLPVDGGVRPLIHRPQSLESRLGGLVDAPGRTWVIDREGWVRAGAGRGAGLGDDPAGRARLDLPELATLSDAGGTARLGDLLLAYAPVSWQGQRVGSVVVEQRIDQLLLSRYGAFAELALATLGLFGLSVAGLLLFASRLAWRIRRLGRETGAALDERGRLLAESLAAEAASGDELGDLSRAISGLLGRLQRHTRFLHALPRTLRHEISNPLNTIATALQNLGADSSPAQRERYLAGANRGLQRLEATLNGLTEAANLDEALQQEEHRPLDLRELLATYLDSLQLQYPERRLLAALPAGAVTVHGAGHRLEQLLDKLFDNALDFTPADGRIGLGLELSGGQAQLRVENSGPPLPPALQGQAGEAMVSSRQPGSGAQHLGLGLFVARRIAEAHGGTLALGNLADGSGVGVSVALPLARPAGRAAG